MQKKVLKSRELSKHLGLKDKVKKGPETSRLELMADEGGVLGKKMLAAKTRSQAMIEDAKKEAERIRREAEELLSQVDAERAKSKEDGYREGREEGLASVTSMLAAFEKMREKFYAGAEEDIVRLVMMIAEKVIGKIVADSGDAIKAIVRQALESALGDRITVKLNPEDHRIVTASGSEFRDVLDKTRRIQFKEDEAIEKGGCIVDTEVGTIDARLETQLMAIRKALEL
jgi:flagellar biosynthesis/type III secretory pathway protein FliH